MITTLARLSHSSRDDARVSQERAGLPQIQVRTSECQVWRAMIGAVPALPDYLLTDVSSACAGYASAYRSSYTVVYKQPKEVA
jgi:hypothetical protein